MSDALTQLDKFKPTTPVNEGSTVARNAPPNFSTGLKIATFCTVCVTLGLAIPLALARRKSGANASAAANLNARSIHRRPSGVSPSALLRQGSFSSHHTILCTTPKPAKVLSVPPTSSNSQPASLDTIIQAFQALGIATGIVTASAGVAVLGFRYWTGIHTISDFTPYMRNKLIQVLPQALMSRLEPADDPLDVIFPQRETSFNEDDGGVSTEQAERRMQQAYAEGGIVKFGQQMWIEFEREWTEARRRGNQLSPHEPNASEPDTTSNVRVA